MFWVNFIVTSVTQCQGINLTSKTENWSRPVVVEARRRGHCSPLSYTWNWGLWDHVHSSHVCQESKSCCFIAGRGSFISGLVCQIRTTFDTKRGGEWVKQKVMILFSRAVCWKLSSSVPCHIVPLPLFFDSSLAVRSKPLLDKSAVKNVWK